MELNLRNLSNAHIDEYFKHISSSGIDHLFLPEADFETLCLYITNTYDNYFIPSRSKIHGVRLKIYKEKGDNDYNEF